MVLSKIIFYLLQDGCTDIDRRIGMAKPASCVSTTASLEMTVYTYVSTPHRSRLMPKQRLKALPSHKFVIKRPQKT